MLHGRKFDYAYDDRGNQRFRYLDAAHSKYWQYSWNGANQLTEARLTDNGATVRTVTFKYDPFGRRIEKRVTGLAPQVPVPLTTTYVYDGEDIILEYVNEGTTTTGTHYVHGPGIDEPLALVRDGQSYYYHADGLGSVVAISDSSKAIVQRYTYESFGMVSASNPAFENPYTYAGREYDKEIGVLHERNRYADLMEGRYISKDPIGFAGEDVNLYRRVQNNPVNWIDPYGLTTWSCKRPIGGKPGQYAPPIIHHGYNCVTTLDGSIKCDSTNASPGYTYIPLIKPGVPSNPNDDYYDSNACKEVDDNKDDCVESCLLTKWQQPRPGYDIGFLGTDCNEYSSDTLNECISGCNK